MGIKFSNPVIVPAPAAGYSNLAIIPANRRPLGLAKQIGTTMNGDILDGVKTRYHQALANINSIVISEEGTFRDVARITIFLTESPTTHLSRNQINSTFRSNRPP